MSNSRPSQSSQQLEVTLTPSPRKRLRLEILNERNPIEDNNYYGVNVRGVTAFREIGRGHQAILNFSRCMNMEEGGNAPDLVRGPSGAVSGAFSE